MKSPFVIMLYKSSMRSKVARCTAKHELLKRTRSKWGNHTRDSKCQSMLLSQASGQLYDSALALMAGVPVVVNAGMNGATKVVSKAIARPGIRTNLEDVEVQDAPTTPTIENVPNKGYSSFKNPQCERSGASHPLLLDSLCTNYI